MELVKLPPGYVLPEGMTLADVCRIEQELLASEGLDLDSLKLGQEPSGENEEVCPSQAAWSRWLSLLKR